MSKIKLGDKVKDTLTPFTGTVVGITHWIHGCDRVSVQTTKLKDGKPLPFQNFDITQLKLVKPRRKKVVKTNNGGPSRMPTRKPDVTRH